MEIEGWVEKTGEGEGGYGGSGEGAGGGEVFGYGEVGGEGGCGGGGHWWLGGSGANGVRWVWRIGSAGFLSVPDSSIRLSGLLCSRYRYISTQTSF